MGDATNGFEDSIHRDSVGSDPLTASSVPDFTRLNIIVDSPQRKLLPLADLWLLDLELMHHFSTVTCESLAWRKDIKYVWQTVVPTVAYQYDFTMHGLLAISALHKARLFPHQKERYLNVSAYHQALGLEGFTPRLPTVSKDNWQPIFTFSSMVVLYVASLPSRSNSLDMISPIEAIFELFSCIRGIQAILEPFLHLLARTRFAPLVHGLWVLDADDESGYVRIEGVFRGAG